MEARLLAFLGIAIILTLTPGPDFALVTRVVFTHGKHAARFTALGVVTGHISWGIASGIGVAAILNTSATLYTILKVAGAAYLIWLGIQALFARGSSHAASHQPAETKQSAPYSTISAYRQGFYRQGLVNDLLNPKIGVFYTTLLPQFIAPGQSAFLPSVLLAALFACIVALWLFTYILLLAQADAFFRRPVVRRWLDRCTGVVLVGLGVRTAIESN
jgi:threonine/homoserine/homoserine lactone efflux protein